MLPAPRALAVAALALLALTPGCRSASEQFLGLAVERGLRAETVAGLDFQHLVLWGPSSIGRELHIYLDGDGTPWLGGHPASDPTPRDPLVLDLLALDRRPAVYLGRPCYHGLDASPSCPSTLWTSERYSETVVSSLTAAARRLVAARAAEHVVWVGYSGGGALAMLVASRVPQTVGVITLAANLDIDAWADRQRTSRLVGSLNPARQPPLPSRIAQRHYLGVRDRIVPVEVGRRGVAPGAEVIVVDADHRCCWAALWRGMLAQLERARPAARD